jgi:glycosyltransferase 2 family protein
MSSATPAHSKRIVKAVLRVGGTVAALGYTFHLMPLGEVLPLLRHSDTLCVMLALAGMQVANMAMAGRLHAFVRHQPIAYMRFRLMIIVHYVSSLYATILPGAIGGDAYKVWWLKKHTPLSMGLLVRMVIAARGSGLWMLLNITAICAFFSKPVAALVPFAPEVLVVGVVFVTAVYLVVLRYIMLMQPVIQPEAEGYSLLGQVAFALTAYFLLLGMGQGAHALEYVVLFMVSCVVAMLPLSIGGIGLREFTLLHTAPLLGVSVSHGVALALAFTLLNLVVAAIGAVLHGLALEKPELHAREVVA